MEFHILDPFTFIPIHLVDHYESAIWTERYIEAGDFSIVLEATPTWAKRLYPGTLLALKGVRDPMLIHTRSIEGGVMTITGNSLEIALNHLYIKQLIFNGVPGNVMGQIAFEAQFNDTGFFGPGERLAPIIPWILGDIETAGSTIKKHVPASQESGAYDTLLAMAKKFNIGMRVYLRAKTVAPDPNPLNAAIVFSTRRGGDLTGQSGADENYIRFSVALQNFANVKEIASVANWINHVLVFPKNELLYQNGSVGTPSIFWSRFSSETNPRNLPPFQIRSAFLDASDITTDMLGPTPAANQQDKYYGIVTRRALKHLNEHKKDILVDGEVPPEGLLKFEKDFKLGDLVQVQGIDNNVIIGRITEYIRSSDNTGAREYPTIVPEPEKVGYNTYYPNYGSDMDFFEHQQN